MHLLSSARSGLVKTGLVAGATVLAVAGPALAAPPYTIDVGGDSSGTVYYFSATSQAGGIDFVVHNVGGDRNMSCGSVTALGTITTGVTNDTVATITSTQWNSCTGVGQDLGVSQLSSWDLDATDTSVVTGLTDDVTGQVSNVNARVKDILTNGSICQFDVVGVAEATFHEDDQTLEVHESSGNLTVDNTVVCVAGAVADGDEADFSGTFDVDVFSDSARTVPAGDVNVGP